MHHTSTAGSNKWLLSEPNKDSQARIFCLPYSGCGASMYRLWPKFFGDIEICPVQLPGRESRVRDRGYESYEDLVKDMLEELSPYFDKDFAFFGHCGSALIAYEATLQLQTKGICIPKRLFISSQVAPHEGPFGRFLHLTDEELRIELEIITKKMGGVPIQDLLDFQVSILCKDIGMNKRYSDKEIVQLVSPLVTFGWTNDSEINPNQMTGWSQYGEVSQHLIEGDHYQFLSAPEEFVKIIQGSMK
ncbi:Linear gramicidin dehydrogenase LgrE [compost metagenome]